MNLRALVRAPLWWTAKLLPLVAAAELAALTAGTPGRDGVARLAAMLVSAVSVAAGAHVVNDLADRAADAAAGKTNAVASSGRGLQVALLVGAALGGALPWVVVPLDPAAGAVLVALVLLSLAYSLPPTRLKGRAVAGVVSDALVAHTLPTTFAFLELGAAGARTGRWWAALLSAVVWSTGFGVRSIVVHEVVDVHGDRLAGVRTYAVARGVPRAVRTGRDAFGLELVGLAGLAVVTAVTSWGVALFFAAHFGLWCHHRRFEHPPIDTVPTEADAWMPLAEFYEVWPAVAFGVALGVRDPVWWWSTLAVVVVFWPAVLKQAADMFGLAVELVGDTGRRVGGFLGEHVVKHLQGVVWPAILRGWHGLGAALRRAWWAVYRAFWHLNRGLWRVRHAIADPIVAFVRRQRRRVRRRLGRPPSGPDDRGPTAEASSEGGLVS